MQQDIVQMNPHMTTITNHIEIKPKFKSASTLEILTKSILDACQIEKNLTMIYFYYFPNQKHQMNDDKRHWRLKRARFAHPESDVKLTSNEIPFSTTTVLLLKSIISTFFSTTTFFSFYRATEMKGEVCVRKCSFRMFFSCIVLCAWKTHLGHNCHLGWWWNFSWLMFIVDHVKLIDWLWRNCWLEGNCFEYFIRCGFFDHINNNLITITTSIIRQNLLLHPRIIERERVCVFVVCDEVRIVRSWFNFERWRVSFIGICLLLRRLKINATELTQPR